jgi:Flp pilus assembly pilin Flp
VHYRIEQFVRRLLTFFASVQAEEEGQGLVEYAAILGFVAATLAVAITFLGPHIAMALNNVTNSF